MGFFNLFKKKEQEDSTVKYLIVGLGNIGPDYEGTRHNIGFTVIEAMAAEKELTFESKRYGDVLKMKFKGRTFVLVKPSTYMNLSGKAVNYWLQQEKIPQENLMVITDDLALPFGKIRIRAKGGDGGHNGLNNIIETLGTSEFVRLRFGIGNEFSKGHQSDYVLSKWNEEEQELLPKRLKICVGAIKSFATIGIGRTMTEFNKK